MTIRFAPSRRASSAEARFLSITAATLRRRESSDLFRLEYRRFLAQVVREHPQAKEIHLVPAVSAPVAVACGLDRLRQVQPHLIIYNDEGPEKGSVETLTIDDRE